MSDNRFLHQAKRQKRDEFYTQLSDIENELRHYKASFRDTTVYCNCDDPYESNFFKYFAANFNALGLRRLLATSYVGSPICGEQLSLDDIEGLEPKRDAFYIDITYVDDFDGDGAVGLSDVQHLLKNDANVCTPLLGNGDFRSAECVELLQQADVVVTNPPFSLFREYVSQLMKYDKQFLIIGDQNTITYKEIFPLIKDDRMWLGNDNGGTKWFRVPMDYDIRTESRKKIEKGIKYLSMGRIVWFTNLDHSKRHEELRLHRRYAPGEFPTYDNYDAIEVGRVADIPVDWDGTMGVPITFLSKWNPEQFEILGFVNGGNKDICIDGKHKYDRIMVRRMQQ